MAVLSVQSSAVERRCSTRQATPQECPKKGRENVRPNGFKAQVVAPSRDAALRYAAHLNDFGVRAYAVITTTPNGGPEFNEARSPNQEQITNAFVDPTGAWTCC